MSRNYIVEIGDENGNSFKVSIATGFNPSYRGSWRTIDKGYIRINNGQTAAEHSNGTLTTQHVKLLGAEGLWGIRLNDFEDMLSVNKEGTGLVLQPWVIGLTHGRVSWAVVG